MGSCHAKQPVRDYSQISAFPGSGGRRLLLCLAWLAVVLAGAGLMPLAGAAAAEPAISPEGLQNFDQLVHLALRQSPYLLKSSLEIEIHRLDVMDSRFALFPTVTFRTYYYLNRPQDVRGFSSQPYSLSFRSDSYNPVGAYLSLQAQKLASQVAVLAHLKVISEGLRNLGKLFLDLGTLKRLEAYQADIVSLSRENLAYAENRLGIGTGTSLEVKVAAQELEAARDEQARLRHSAKRTLEQIKAFVGLKRGQDLRIDLSDASRQVLGSFEAAAASLAQAKDRSYDLKILKLREELQGYNVSLAKAKILPSLIFTTQSPDPLSVNTSHGLYVGFGLEVPVWDGFTRLRNVSRQKAVLKQFGAERNLKELDLNDQWEASRGEVQEAAAAAKLSRSQEEVARLRERQAQIRYQAGSIQLPDYLAGRKGLLEAEKNGAMKAMNADAALLNFRLISGDLGQSYVDQNAWQN
jgi:outer membrane protein TolC